MIIKARHHPVVDPFFTWYVKRTVKRHFHEIRFINRFEDKGWPVLLIANHMSWWDGMWLRVFNQLGQMVGEPVHEDLPQGLHERMWQPGSLAPGTYFFHLESGGMVSVRKAILTR